LGQSRTTDAAGGKRTRGQGVADVTAGGSAPPKLTVWQKAMFGIGSAAFGVKDGGFNVFLLLFYNQIVGISATKVSLAIAIAIVVDAFVDPFIGVASDRWRSRLGRRHPFMFASAIPVAVLYFLLWTPPHWSEGAMFGYVLVISITLRIFIAMYEVPSAALIPELSRDYDERTSILSWRLFFQLVIPAGVYVFTLNTFMKSTPDYTNGMLNPSAYFPYAVLASLVMLGSILFSSLGTRSRIPYLKTNLGAPTVSVMQVIRESFRSLSNPSFILVTVSGLFSAMATGVNNSIGSYLGIYFWKFSSAQLSVLGFAAVIASFIAPPLSPWASRRFGKKRAGIALAVLWLFFFQSPPLLKLLGLMPPEGSAALLTVLFFTTVIGWSLILAALILLLSMITDINEDNELRTGQRAEGVFAAAGSFMNKIVTGAGILVGGVLIDLVHFPAHATPQSIDPQIIRNLVSINIPVQVILIGIAMVLLGMYKIDRAKHEDNLKKIADAVAAEASVVQKLES
jgi:Na+/melibiose symporter-like transporter